MAFEIDETLFPFDVALYLNPKYKDWEQNPEHLILQYIHVMRKWSKECHAVSVAYGTYRDFEKFFQKDKPKKALIKIFKQFCISKKRSRLEKMHTYDFASSFDHEIYDFHHVEMGKNFCQVFFTNKKQLPLYKFTLKYLKKRWYIEDFFYFQNMRQWNLRDL